MFLDNFWPPCVTRESAKPIFQNNNADCEFFFFIFAQNLPIFFFFVFFVVGLFLGAS
jgi:hypothetical protein